MTITCTPKAAFAPRISYPLVTSAVPIPRQLAPTVGPWAKGVYITGEALLGIRRIAVGEIIIKLSNNRNDPDAGSDQIEIRRVNPQIRRIHLQIHRVRPRIYQKPS